MQPDPITATSTQFAHTHLAPIRAPSVQLRPSVSLNSLRRLSDGHLDCGQPAGRLRLRRSPLVLAVAAQWRSSVLAGVVSRDDSGGEGRRGEREGEGRGEGKGAARGEAAHRAGAGAGVAAGG